MSYSHPECPAGDPAECRVRTVGHSVTAIAWAPVYDGHGNMTNFDPNTFSTSKVCDTCGAEWTELTNALGEPIGDVDTRIAPGAKQ